MRQYPSLHAAPLIMHRILDTFVSNPEVMVTYWDIPVKNTRYWLRLFGYFRKMAREQGPIQWRELDAAYFIRAQFMPDGRLMVRRSPRGPSYDEAARILGEAMLNPSKTR